MPGRRAIKWFATLAAFVIAAAFVATLVSHTTLQSRYGHTLTLARGALWVTWGQRLNAIDITRIPFMTMNIEPTPAGGKPLVWAAEFDLFRTPGYLTLPLWAPFAILALLAIALWRREHLAGHCRDCGYDLTGNTSGVCPECGRPTPAAPARPTSDPDTESH